MTVSRRKFQEAVRCLKSAIKNDGLSWAQRIRCVELLMLIYGVPVPESSKRNKRAVRELIEERAGERALNDQIKAAVRQRIAQEAETKALEAEHTRHDSIASAMDAILRVD